MTPGIHLVHKPIGPTSFSIVQQFKSTEKNAPKICHGGTLDPFASGLLLILVEPATKLFHYLHDIPKTYEATVQWGIETDNGDPLGRIVSTGDSSNLSPDQLDEAIKAFVSWQEQTPHATSNKRIDGERAYVKAHRGETVVMPPSKVYLHEAQWIKHDLPNESRLRLTARGGYYVRAFARDLGRKLGCGAHLSQLHRISIGPWNDPGAEITTEIHGRDILPWLFARILSDQDVGELRQKKPIPRATLLPADWNLPTGFPDPQSLVRAFHRDRLCFLLKAEGNLLLPIAAFPGGL